MKLTIKNIGTIQKADIKLSNLTVIAGENDTGKSTIGKLMFSIIKAISKYEDELGESKRHNIVQKTEKIYFFIRRNFDIDSAERKLFHPRYFMDSIENDGINAVDKRIKHLKKNKVYSDTVEHLFDSLKVIINRKDDKKSLTKRAFQKVMYSEFNGEISSKNSNTSSVKIFEENNKILDIVFKKNQLSEFNLQDDLYFNDSVIIETPMILNFSESIRNSKSLFEDQDKLNRLHSLGRANIAFHAKDLELKLRDSVYGKNLFSKPDTDNLYEKITEIIGGKIKFMRKDREFVYLRGKEKHQIINVASGIKSFGILQMLLSGDFLDERTLIVLDEPEVHLHPNWQLKYAEIITLLVKNNFNILVTTHSPYMLEALERYSEKYEIGANFYLAQNGVIESKNNNETLSEIVAKLSEPFSVFDKMDAEKL
jgi:predicted ATPase